MNYTVRFKIVPEADIVFSSPPGLSILEAARQAGLDIDSPCSGNGTCGKCLVKVFPECHDSDSSLSGGTLKGNWLLACQTKIYSSLTVEIPETLRVSKNNMKIIDIRDEREQAVFNTLKEELKSLDCFGDSGLELIPLKLKEPSLDDSTADSERLLRALNETVPDCESAEEVSIYALRKLSAVLREGFFSCTCVVNRSQGRLKVMDVSAGRPQLAGLAIDIGTTSVSAILTDIQTGEILASGSMGNPQVRWGADVINRIIESTRPGGLERLRQAIVHDCLVPLIQELTERIGIETGQIYKAAIAANTTMTHLFIGVPPEYLRLEPYVPAFFRTKGFKAADLDLPVYPEANVLVAPSVGSYVGGDISAGLFASMLFRKESHSLFIDLGTNGELVFGSKEFLMTCACSAGPAFEGGDISCGMRAAAGAIDSVRITAETLEPCLTIMGGNPDRKSGGLQPSQPKPAGICGSGLIDLVAELFASGCIDSRGKIVFNRSSKRLRRDEYGMASYVLVFAEETENRREIFISEGDIENFIRAKAAIYSAIRTMLSILDFNMKDIENVYIAGGIGSGINIEKAVSIGMLPNIPKERFHYLGNTSLAGAYAMLQSQKAAQKIDEIAGMMTYLELSSHPSYMDEFVAACFLPHTNYES